MLTNVQQYIVFESYAGPHTCSLQPAPSSHISPHSPLAAHICRPPLPDNRADSTGRRPPDSLHDEIPHVSDSPGITIRTSRAT